MTENTPTEKPKQTRNRARKSPPRRPVPEDSPLRSPERIAKLREGLARYYAETPPHLRKTRRGSPDGVRERKGRKKHAKVLNEARKEAIKVVQYLKQDGGLDADAAGEAVLVDTVVVVLAKKDDGAPVYGVADRLKAAATALPFLRAKPEAKTAVRVETAEDFFARAAKAASEHGQPE